MDDDFVMQMSAILMYLCSLVGATETNPIRVSQETFENLVPRPDGPHKMGLIITQDPTGTLLCWLYLAR